MPTNGEEGTFGSWLDVAFRAGDLILVALLVDSAFIFVFFVALQAYLPETLHGSEAVAPVALTAYGIAKLASEFAGGITTDRLGTHISVVIGLAMLTAGNIAIIPLAYVMPWLVVVPAFSEGIGAALV